MVFPLRASNYRRDRLDKKNSGKNSPSAPANSVVGIPSCWCARLCHWKTGLAEPTDELKLTFTPEPPILQVHYLYPQNGVRLVIGPEGGLSDDEIALTEQYYFQEMLLGPRVLRTETAALTAITALQCRFGDSVLGEQMSIKLGIVMEPLFSPSISKRHQFYVIGSPATWLRTLLHGDERSLSRTGGISYATMRPLEVRQDYTCWYSLGEVVDQPLHELDVILMRKDPPFDTEFIYATYLLERAEEQGTLIVNKPQSLRDANENYFTAWFAEHTPTTLVTRSSAKLRSFHQQHQDVILKPLDGMGGASIFA